MQSVTDIKKNITKHKKSLGIAESFRQGNLIAFRITKSDIVNTIRVNIRGDVCNIEFGWRTGIWNLKTQGYTIVRIHRGLPIEEIEEIISLETKIKL